MRNAIKEWRQAALTVFLLHNNTDLHNAKLIKNLIANLKWEEFAHLPFSTDLAPSDYQLLQLKKELGRHFSMREELVQWVNSIFRNLVKEFYHAVVIEEPITWYQKWLD